MNQLKSSKELKAMARAQLNGNYRVVTTSVIILYVIHFLVSTMITSSGGQVSLEVLLVEFILSLVISFFMHVFAFGFAKMYLKLSCHQQISISDIFAGFAQNLNHNLTVSIRFVLLVYLPISAGNLLLTLLRGYHVQYAYLIGGVILLGCFIFALANALQYGLVFFITLDFPQYDSNKAYRMSSFLMKKQKGRLFLTLISFIPIYLLSFLTLPIGLVFTVGCIWIIPYMIATYTNFYLNLVKSKTN